MSIENALIGVDLDGVCSDFYGRMREIAAEWFECKICFGNTTNTHIAAPRAKSWKEVYELVHDRVRSSEAT